MKGFVSVTAHFVDKSWQLKSYVLRALALEVSLDDEDEIAHENADTLLKFLTDTLQEYQVPSSDLSWPCPVIAREGYVGTRFISRALGRRFQPYDGCPQCHGVTAEAIHWGRPPLYLPQNDKNECFTLCRCSQSSASCWRRGSSQPKVTPLRLGKRRRLPRIISGNVTP